MKRLPPHLIEALSVGHSEEETFRLVTRLELYGVSVVVRRLKLGSMKSADFGTWTEIYRTPVVPDFPSAGADHRLEKKKDENQSSPE
jgi:hypothetical protein